MACKLNNENKLIFMNYKTCKEYIRSDYYRIYGEKQASLVKMWMKSIWCPGFHFMFWWRLSHIDGCLSFFAKRIIHNIIE